MVRHLILYDSECGLCNRLNQFVLNHDRREIFDFASLQGPKGQNIRATFGVSSDTLETIYLVTDYLSPHPSLLARSTAALRIAWELGWPWKALMILNILPVCLRDGIYNWVARNRHRFFRDAICRLPDEGTQSRFLDY